ncbi:MAG TPA: VCBS repeat-containing protein [bacterium]|nr:VCBS repeat-containing protein [bacterium]
MKSLIVMLSVLFGLTALYAVDDSNIWPQRNFDSARTGRTPGIGDIVTPELKWSYFTGGSSSDLTLRFDENSLQPFVFTMGGHAVRKGANDKAVWDTGTVGLQNVLGMLDVNGDGSREIFTYGTDTLRILDAATGDELFSHYLQNPAVWALADVDNDGDVELLLRPERAVSALKMLEIADDITNPTVKWEVTTGLPKWATRPVFGDLDGNSTTKEMIFDSAMNYGRLWIMNATTGQLLRYRNVQVTVGKFSDGIRMLANLDDDPQNEFVFTGNAALYTNTGSIHISIYDYLNDAIQWHYEYGMGTSDVKLDIVPESVADLDGDGAKEVVISVYNDTLELVLVNGVRVDRDEDGINLPNRWVTIVLDAATGAVKGYLPDQHLEGVADLNGDGRPEIVLKNASALTVPTYGSVTAYNFSGGAFITRWNGSNLNLLSCARPMREDMDDTNVRRSACIKDFDGDGANELIAMHDSDGDGLANSVSIVQNGGSLTHQIPLALGEEMAFIYGNGTDLVLSRNTGHVFWYKVGPGSLTSHATIRAGGFSTDSVLFAEKGNPRLVSRESTKKMFLLDTLTGSPNAAPKSVWNMFSAEAVEPFSFDRDGTGNYGFLRRIRNAAGDMGLELRTGTGALLWTNWYAGIKTGPAYFVSGDFNGDGMADIAYFVEYPDNATGIEAVNGRTGALLYSHSTIDMNSYRKATPMVIPDMTGDGISDLFVIHNVRSELLDGATGVRIGTVETGANSQYGFAADTDGDGAVELFGNAMALKRMMELDNTNNWEIKYTSTSSYYNVVLNHAGLADIDTNPGLDVALGGQYGDLSAYSGLDGSVLWKQCLYLGMSIELPDASYLTRTDCPGAKLSNIASGDIDGDGLEEFVVGSPDGYLYVVNTEDGSLAWSWLFDYAVGNPILADIDDDGLIEIVVGVADGYLYAIDQKRYTETFPTREVVIKNGKIQNVGTDIDSQAYAGYIGVAWSPVFKAKGYDVRIVNASGAVITDVVTVTNGFQAIITDADIVSGQTYYAEVRGYDAKGYYSDWNRGDGAAVNVPAATSLMSKIRNLFR